MRPWGKYRLLMDSFTSSVIGEVSSFAASLISLGGIVSYPGPFVESILPSIFLYHFRIPVGNQMKKA